MRRWRVAPLVVGIVLVAGIVSAASDTGLPVPVALAVAALGVLVAAILVAGAHGFRLSRKEGRAFWPSLGAGARLAFRTMVDLF